MVEWWFTYPPYDQHDFLARVLGRSPELTAAELRDYQRVKHKSYTHLNAAEGQSVKGGVLPMQPGDLWLLDDEFGVAQGYYRRVQVSVKTEDDSRPAWVMVGGPSLSWAIQGQEESEST